MGIKDLMKDTESKQGKAVYTTMRKLLDKPGRATMNNPEVLVGAAGVKHGDIVLEIGCGSGFFTEEISKRVGTAGKVYATDINEAAIEQTQAKTQRLGLSNVVVQKDDAMHSAFDDGMFDVVLLYGVVPAPVISMEDISREILRMLKPGGMYAIWTATPFWTPYKVCKQVPLEKLPKERGVFRLRKPR